MEEAPSDKGDLTIYFFCGFMLFHIAHFVPLISTLVYHGEINVVRRKGVIFSDIDLFL